MSSNGSIVSAAMFPASRKMSGAPSLPVSNASAAAIREGRSVAPPSPIRASTIRSSSNRRKAAHIASAKSPARRLNSAKPVRQSSPSKASAERAARADRKMPDMPGNPGQKRAERTTGNRPLETSVPGKPANTQLALVLTHIIEGIDAIDVDQARGAGEPEIHRRHET